MEFRIDEAIFAALPALCVGVVAAEGVDNRRAYPEVEALLDRAGALAAERFAGAAVKEAPEILPYREAFRALGINPNKYPCSVEALFSRVAKGKPLPRINPLVDLNNAVSLARVLPMGTHDLGCSPEDIVMRPAAEGDRFLPFGGTEEEAADPGEPVYAVGRQVRTRRWTWRQSEHGKITPETSRVFFPIDGFAGVNDGQVRAAAAELAETLEAVFRCRVRTGFVDREHPACGLDL